MRKYLIFSFILFISFQAYCQSLDSIDNIQGITPKEYFSSGRISYYFGYDGIISIKMDNTSLIINNKINLSNKGYGNISLGRLLNGVEESLYSSDDSLVIYKTTSDYSCKNNPENNCLYAPIYIRKISKKSLTGNISLYRIDKSIPLEEKDVINFPAGAELYSIVVEVPSYDLDTFTDMASLICSKNEENLCRGVISNGVLDKAALFELSSIKGENKEFLYKDTEDGLVYQFNLADNILIPYNKVCVESIQNIDDLQGCVENSMPNGSITQHKHPSGIIYWEIDYKNPAVDNILFWVNNRGEPFKAYTNSRLVYNFSLFNDKAADVISKLFTNN